MGGDSLKLETSFELFPMASLLGGWGGVAAAGPMAECALWSGRMGVRERNNVRVGGDGKDTIFFAHGFGCDQNMWRELGGVPRSAPAKATRTLAA
jgi:hypothetical protein